MNNLVLEKDSNIFKKIGSLKWGMVLLILCVAFIGFTALYSASGGDVDPWASRQMLRFLLGMGALFFIALVDIRFWLGMAYPLYILGLVLLVIVEVMGQVGMGAQRWINLGFMQLQPSELMKITVVMALAKYFHTATPEDVMDLKFLARGSIFIIAPVCLVLLQPDLGTSLMIVFAGIAVFFLVGAPIWIFISGGVLSLLSMPVAWLLMHDYQKKRVMTFLNPESDPLGAGYHITQSKIALGSGGVFGKGFLEGTQSRLNFLPEKQTDFIFTLWAEEWGLVGGLALLSLFGLLFFYGMQIALKCRHAFGQILAMGLMVNFSLYVFINIAMVMGLIPVVGAPLPLISYGGTSMLAALIGFGLILCCDVHRDAKLPRMSIARSGRTSSIG